MKQNPLLQYLNRQQGQAVQDLDANVLVDAGPGTGKTRVLTARIAWLLQNGCEPGRILAITFTNKAATEMQERIRKAGLSPDVCITTFHSWAFRFLSESLSKEKRSVVIGEQDQKKIFGKVLKSLDIQGKTSRLLEKIQFLKQFYPPRLRDEPEEVRTVFEAYQDYLKAHGLFDYDDLIISAASFLEKLRDADPLLQPFDHLLVDEFQDVSQAQYRLCQLLAGRSCRVMAIGDPNQSIYGFRGSDPVFMERFVTDFHPCTRIRLLTAYRCPQKFLDAAGSVLGNKGLAEVRSERKKEAEIIFRQFKHQRSEAAWIARKIDNITGGISFESLNQGTASGHDLKSLSQVAVLFRINRMGENIAEELEKAGIPFQLARDTDAGREEKLNMLWHLLEFLAGRNIDHHLSMFQPDIRKRLETMGNEMLRKLQGMPPDAFLEMASGILGQGFDSSEKILLSNALESHRQGRFLPLAMKTEQDRLDFQIEAVSLMSIHAAKGLEFPVVFIAGCEDGILPWEKGEVPEERRLFYVGLTRASRQIFLTAARTRIFWGKTRKMQPSPFLEDMGRLLVREEARPPRKRKKRPAQKKLF